MSTMTEAARHHLVGKGFRPVFETFGVQGCGKSRSVEIQAGHWRITGHETVVEDEITRDDGMTGARLWARKV